MPNLLVSNKECCCWWCVESDQTEVVYCAGSKRFVLSFLNFGKTVSK